MPSREQIMAELQRRQSTGHPDAEMIKAALGGTATATAPAAPNPATAGVSQNPYINDLIQKATKPSVRQGVGDFLTTLGGGKPADNSIDLSKIYAEQAIKSQFKDPTETELRQAEIDALKTPPPTGFVRVGKQTLADPDYVKPPSAVDQIKIDEAEREKVASEEGIKNSAQQNLTAIEHAKKGSKYFGVAGNLPSWAAPENLLGLNAKGYSDRKDWENNIKQLLSQKVVDLITEMKKASKTGATGFGQLSEKEGALLREASTALSRDLPPDRAIYYLNEMEKINKKILGNGVSHIPSEAQAMTPGAHDLSGVHTFNSPEEADASNLPLGTIVKAINPASGKLEDYEIG